MAPASAWFWNGTAFEPSAGLPLTDRGFRYGQSLFESLAVRGGRVEFLPAHLARLEMAARRLGWPVDRRALDAAGACLEVFLPGPVFARIYLTAGDGPPGGAVQAPRLFVFGEPRPGPLPKGATIVERIEPHLPLPGGLKTANYWPNLSALEAARAAGADEALLFHPDGTLISASMANVFLVLEDGTVATPPLESGARAGVVREWVLARQPVEERHLERPVLSRVRECFLTSSWRGITPVHRLNSRPLERTVGEALRTTFETRA